MKAHTLYGVKKKLYKSTVHEEIAIRNEFNFMQCNTFLLMIFFSGNKNNDLYFDQLSLQRQLSLAIHKLSIEFVLVLDKCFYENHLFSCANQITYIKYHLMQNTEILYIIRICNTKQYRQRICLLFGWGLILQILHTVFVHATKSITKRKRI